MKLQEKYDSLIVGLISGLFIPIIIGTIIFLFSSGEMTLGSYLLRLKESDIITHSITLCVFPNIFIFLLFNRFDMLHAARGTLAVTIVWAIIVFAVKFLS
ncbi:MAG: hypothetical protein IPN67_20920 [Bacteroidales bacterium]|nr:hypothetical protein [Bacteroidales bacterium]